MKTTTRWIMFGTLIGVALAPATFLATRRPAECSSSGVRLFDCCRTAKDGEAACCTKCCWWPRGCGACPDPAVRATGAS